MSKPKSDRIHLLETLQANTSPVFMLYRQPGEMAAYLEKESLRKPVIETGTVSGERHSLWAITDRDIVQRIHASLADEPLYIADGHHRYESALANRQARRNQVENYTGNEDFNFVMVDCVDFNDPGLIILPTHRLVKGIAEPVLNGLNARLADYFDTREIPAGAEIPDDLKAFFEGGKEEIRLAIFGLAKSTYSLLTLKDIGAAAALMPPRSDFYKKLDVSVVDHLLLEKIMGMTDLEGPSINFVHDTQDAVNKVRLQEYQLAIILRPVSPGAVKDIADARDRMPRKSTYFYPKIPSGLVFYKFNQ
jgi:uncharacterized protein (DUF1015 family)